MLAYRIGDFVLLISISFLQFMNAFFLFSYFVFQSYKPYVFNAKEAQFP